MPRIDCPHCGKLGLVSSEHVIKAVTTVTTYYCDACHTEWDERDGHAGPLLPRKRPPKTHRDKTTES